MIPFFSSDVPGCKVAMLRINPALDDQNGDAAAGASVTTLPETLIVSRLFSNNLPSSAVVDTNGNVYVCYYDSYSETSTPPRGSLSFAVLNSAGTPISETRSLTGGATATTAEELTLPAIAIDDSTLPGTSYITWTDDWSGNEKILLRIMEPAGGAGGG